MYQNFQHTNIGATFADEDLTNQQVDGLQAGQKAESKPNNSQGFQANQMQ